MTDREVMRQALEALEDLGMKHVENTGETLHADVYTALRAQLEQPKQKPVAWLKEDWTGGHLNYETAYEGAFAAFPVYLAPPAPQARQPLTDEMVQRAMLALNTASCGELEPTVDEMKAALEAAHDIGETP
jgi:hypothetical protein